MTRRAVVTLIAVTFIAACGGSDSPSASSPGDPTPPPAADKWTTVAPMPERRGNVAGAALDGKLYLAGGHLLTGTGITLAAPLYIYDAATNAWSVGADLPEPMHHPVMAAHAGKLYLFGGFRVAELSNLWIYDVATDSWSAGAPMPTQRAAAGAAVIGGVIHVVGGVGVGSSFAPPLPHIVHEVYDIAAGTWTTGTSMPTGREHAGVAALDGKLYVVSGHAASATTDRVDVYDPATQQWSQLASLPTRRGGGALLAFQGELYMIGGELLPPSSFFGSGFAEDNPGATIYAGVEIYNPGTGTWRTGNPMPTARQGFGAGVIGNAIIVAGGAVTTGSSFLDLTERWDP